MTQVATDARPGGSPEPSEPRSASRRASLLLAIGVLVAVLPIVSATARAVVTLDWFPVGDNGVVYARTTEVFSDDTPLLYMWSTGSTWAEEAFNNPGPLFYWVLAGPSALLGPTGAAIAVALLNIGAVVGIAVVALRRGGTVVAAAAVLVTALLTHTMGSAQLYDPWPPNSLLLPFLLYLLLAWSAADGDLLAIPLMAGVGSLLLETNLSYALLVPGLGLWAVGVVVVHLRRERRRDPDGWPALRRRARRCGAVAVAVMAVLWTPTVIEQLTADEGNLTLIVRGMQDLPYSLGASGALRLLAGVTALPAFWFRGSMSDVYADPPSTAVALVGALVVAAVVVALVGTAFRRHDRVSVAGLATATCALAITFATLARSPVDFFGELSPYRTRFLWPVAAMTTLVIGVALARRFVQGHRARELLVAVLVLTTAAVAVANVPRFDQPGGTHEPPYTLSVVEDLRRQLDDFDEDSTVFVDWVGASFNEQFYMSGVIAELADRGVSFKVEDTHLLRTFGAAHRFTGRNADVELTLRTGERVFERDGRSERLALHDGLSGAQRTELGQLRAELVRYVDDGRLRLTPEGEAALERLNGRPWEAPDGREFIESGDVLALFGQGFLRLDGTWGPRFARYALLAKRSDDRTAAVFVRPIG